MFVGKDVTNSKQLNPVGNDDDRRKRAADPLAGMPVGDFDPVVSKILYCIYH